MPRRIRVKFGDLPVPAFTFSPTSGTAPLTVTFNNTTPGTNSYAWDFENNGSTDNTLTNPVVQLGAGTYYPKLTATNSVGSVSKVSTVALTIAAVPTETTATLSLLSSGQVGAAYTFRVTLDSAATQARSIQLSATGSPTYGGNPGLIPVGQATCDITVTWASAGSYQVALANANGLTILGSPISVTVSAPAVQSTDDLPTNTITTNTTSAVGVTYGQAFRQTAVAAGQQISGYQLVPKNYWPDGSVKFGILSRVFKDATSHSSVLTLGAGETGTALTTGDLIDAAKGNFTSATVTAGAFGSASFTTGDLSAPFETWVSGPVMSSWIYRKEFTGGDAHLVAWLEVRLFKVGASFEVEVLPWIENGYLLVANPTNKSARYTFAMGGSTRFDSVTNIDLPHHCRTPLLSGTATSYWLGTARDVVIRHDGDYLQATGLVPAYHVKPADGSAQINALLATSFAPLQLGDWPSGMGSGGYHKSIGLLPEWDVLYLTNGNATTYKAMIFNGYSAGRYPYHYREDPTFGTVSDRYKPTRLANHPWLNIREPSDGWETTPLPSGTAPPSWSITHQPSAGFVAYLVTGRRYFLDEIQFVGSTNSIYISSTAREGPLGYYKSESGNERYVAWTLRSLAQALVATPDADTALQGDYRTIWSNNVNYYHSKYVGAGGPSAPRINNGGFVQTNVDVGGPEVLNGTTVGTPTATTIAFTLGNFRSDVAQNNHYVGWHLTIGAETRTVTASVNSIPGNTVTMTVSPGFSSAPGVGVVAVIDDDRYWVTSWMNDFITAAFGYAKDVGLGLSTQDTTKHSEFFQWKAGSIVGRFGGTGTNEFLYRDYGPVYICIAPTNAPNWTTGAGPWYINQGNGWGDLYTNLYSGTTAIDTSLGPYASLGPKVEGSIRTWFIINSGPIAGLAAMAYAVKHGVPGAEQGWRRLTTSSNWHSMQADMDVQPVWGIAPAPLPKWARGLAQWQWKEITGTSMGLPAAMPTNEVRTTAGGAAIYGPAARIDAYCGVNGDQTRSTMWTISAGGHGDYYGNEVVKIDLRADAPAWSLHFAGSNGNVLKTLPGGDPGLIWYTDGLPASRHTYGQQFTFARQGYALSLGGSIAGPGSAYTDVYAFSTNTAKSVNGWAAVESTNPNPFPGLFNFAGYWAGAVEMTMCQDPTTEVIYHWSEQGLWKYAPNSTVGATATKLQNVVLNSGRAGCAAVDFSRSRILWTHGAGGPPTHAHVFDSTSGALISTTAYTGAAAATFATMPTYMGMIYEPRLDAYLVRDPAAGGRVFRINAGTFEVTTQATNGGDTIPLQGGSPNNQGIFNKWQYMPHLRGVIYITGHSRNMWFLRTH